MSDLKKLRIKKGLTQKELSEKTGINLRTVQNFEQGKANLKGASVITVIKILKELDTTAEVFFKEEV